MSNTITRGVIPHLACRNASEAVEFYQKAFGAEAERVLKMPNGQLMHAELKLNGASFYLGEECPDYGCPGPESLGGTPVSLHLEVADCDAVFQQAIESGCQVVMPLQEMFWGARYGVLSDPYGHKWSVATMVREVGPEELQKAMEAFCAQPQA